MRIFMDVLQKENDLDTRKYPKNFTLRKYVYEKLLTIMEDNGFKVTPEKESGVVAVFITKKIIVDYGKRINQDRFLKGDGALDPIPQRLQPGPKENVIVHIRLTEKENQYLENLVKYHFFIDDNNVKHYSKFLASVILDKWHKREEKLKKMSGEEEKKQTDVSDDLDDIDLEPNTENWVGRHD